MLERSVSKFVLLSGLLYACNSTTLTRSDTKLWLDVCRDDVDCAADMVCECGVCSQHCAKDAECAAHAVSAVCAGSIPDTSLCSEHAKLESICEIECSANSDCRALGERGVCSGGWCRRATADSFVDGGLLNCEDQSARIHDALQPTLDRADRSCVSDSDCTRATLSNACYGNGCDAEYVASAAADQISGELASLEDEFCPAAFKAGCTGPARIVFCPLQHMPKCVANSCESGH